MLRNVTWTLLLVLGLLAGPALAADETQPEPTSAVAKAEMLLKQGKFEEARDAYLALAKADPENEGQKIPDEQFEGKWLVQFKSQHKPTIVDGTGVKVPSSIKIFPGDEIRISYQENPIEDGAVTGFFMYLGSAQLIKKNSDGGGMGEAAANAFGAVEGGYDASAAAAAAAAEEGDESSAPPADGDY